MRVLVFGGTTEGRLLSHALARRGAAVTVCVATAYGREEQGDEPGVTVLTGRRTEREMEELLEGMDLCIDATHPYAVAVSTLSREACKAVGVPYRRLLRAKSESEGVEVESATEAASLLANMEGNVLLTTGAKELPAFSALEPERLYPRILPSHEGLAACEAAGIPHRNIIAMQGPFSRELNEALIRQYDIRSVVTKDGGAAGGFSEKAAAAVATGATLVVLRRPEETGETMETLLREVEAMLAREARGE